MFRKIGLMVLGGYIVGASAVFLNLNLFSYPYPWYWVTLAIGFIMVFYGAYVTARDEKVSS